VKLRTDRVLPRLSAGKTSNREIGEIEQADDPADEHEATAAGRILALLADDRGLWTVAEVERAIGDQINVADVLTRLRTSGLVHQLGDFVFASRPAIEAADIWVRYSASVVGDDT
jgi:hypothetical protein